MLPEVPTGNDASWIEAYGVQEAVDILTSRGGPVVKDDAEAWVVAHLEMYILHRATRLLERARQKYRWSHNSNFTSYIEPQDCWKGRGWSPGGETHRDLRHASRHKTARKNGVGKKEAERESPCLPKVGTP